RTAILPGGRPPGTPTFDGCCLLPRFPGPARSMVAVCCHASQDPHVRTLLSAATLPRTRTFRWLLPAAPLDRNSAPDGLIRHCDLGRIQQCYLLATLGSGDHDDRAARVAGKPAGDRSRYVVPPLPGCPNHQRICTEFLGRAG